MGKLWAKGYELNKLIETFTVGDDYILDRRLIVADCLGSIAHASMLGSVGLLSAEETSAIVNGLRTIARSSADGEFTVDREDEDGHTAIENALVESLGDVGKKVHTGRSRNDQVLAALRLFERDYLLTAIDDLLSFVEDLIAFARDNAEVPMVGRTHMQPAMPSSVGLWAASWAEQLLVDAGLLEYALTVVNRSPLGSAASYGTALPQDRRAVAQTLGFDGLLTNVLWANNSRGKIEAILLDGLDHVGLTLSKLAADLILFSLPEFGYFALPEELCTGSSIMPQKRNPDGLELVRGKSASISGLAQQVKNVIRSLPSGYNRDSQETKGPLFRGMDSALGSIRVMALTIRSLSVNEERLRAAFSKGVFATDAAYDLVAQGVPFRDAYRQVAENLDSIQSPDPVEAIRNRTAPGTAGNLCLDAAESELSALRSRVESKATAVRAACTTALGFETSIFRE